MTIVVLTPLERRIVCECCRLPTLRVTIDPYLMALLAIGPQTCPFCEWENPEIDSDGAFVPRDAGEAAERNGSHALAEARENAARFQSMYDPAQREPWMPEPPSPDELVMKRDFVALHERLAVAIEEERANLVLEILETEAAIAAADLAREQRAHDAADAELDPDATAVFEDRRGPFGLRSSMPSVTRLDAPSASDAPPTRPA